MLGWLTVAAMPQLGVRVGAGAAPGEILVRRCARVRLLIRCAGCPGPCAVVFPDLGRMVTLSAGHEVPVELEVAPGTTYRFETCGGRAAGTLVVAA